MADWVDVYISIYEKLQEKLEALQIDSALAFNKVYLGRKQPPRDFPCCYIYPMRFRTLVATTVRTQFPMPFEIHVVSKDPTAAGGLEDALRRLGEVEKMFNADRNFEGLADNLEMFDFTPEVERPRVKDRHEASFVVTFYRIL